MNQEKIGKFIQENRKKQKLTQEELAEKLGVSKNAVSKWERGICLMDMSLLKPLSEILEVSINDILSGEVIDKENYEKVVEENLINTINYGKNEIRKNNRITGIIYLVGGVLITLTALTIFASDSSWGSIYSVIGGIVALIGFSKLIKHLEHMKRLLFNFLFFLTYVALLFIVDYIAVVTIVQAPRFAYTKSYIYNMVVYENPFYNVYRINFDTENEYYIIDKDKKYTVDTVPNVPFDRDKTGIDNLINYKSKYIGDNSNTSGLISNLPLSQYGYTIEIKNETELYINYHITDWYINEDYYLERSLVYNSVSIFALIDNVSKITFNFSGTTYNVTRDSVYSNFPNMDLITKDGINKDNFNLYLENEISREDIIEIFYKRIFIDENLNKTTKVEVKLANDKKNIITDKKEIDELVHLMNNATKITGVVNADGPWWEIYFYEDDELIYKMYAWGSSNNYGCSFGLNNKEFLLIGLNGEKFKNIITE